MAEVTLRPMTLGQVLDTTFGLYKRNFWLFVGITALPFLLILFFQIAGAVLGTSSIQTGKPPAISAGLVGGLAVGVVVGVILYLLIFGYTQAATIFAVSDLYLGRVATVRGSFAKVGAKILRIMLIFLLIVIAVILAIFAVALMAGILGAITGSPLIVGVLFILGGIAALVFFCRLALWIPAAMLKNAGALTSFQRSIHLTKGYAMRIFLIYFLVFVLAYAAILIFQLPFLAMGVKAAVEHRALPLGMVVLQHLGTFVSQVLVGPIGTIATSLMYYNLRVRKEAFDIQHLMDSLQDNPSSDAPAAI